MRLLRPDLTLDPKENTEKKKRIQSILEDVNMTPAPNAYHILGDFDFSDPTLPDGSLLKDRGKIPRFQFGIRSEFKDKGIDFPGPGEYE